MKSRKWSILILTCSILLLIVIGVYNFMNMDRPDKQNDNKSTEQPSVSPDNTADNGSVNDNITIDGNVEVWLSTIDQQNLLTQQESITPSAGPHDPQQRGISIIVDDSKKYQEMDGFGASFTDASAWLVANVLDKEAKDDLMKKLFSTEDGIGISFLRQPMGATDFALKAYTYDDMPKGSKDFDLEHFSIDMDKEYIIPLLKEAMSINPQIKIMATPWSPPAWMKTTDSLIGGALRPDSYQALANYFVKYIKAYEAEGIPIYAVSVQNEPLYTPAEYPGMKMDQYIQATFIKDYLGPAFRENNIDTKIIAYDHNWDNTKYAKTVLQSAGEFTAGSAWHCYGGTHDAMTEVKKAFPDKDIWFTEASGGEWVPPFNDAFMDQMMHVIRGTRNYAKSVVWWNIALDENNGPTLLSNSTCRGLVKIDQQTKDITYNVDYYTMGHISKFVQPGAYRIESNNYKDNVESTAFQNPDGSIVLILSNRTAVDRKIKVTYHNSIFTYDLTGKSAVTLKWK